MATRIYLPSTGSPDVTPSDWEFANLAGTTYDLKGVISKISSAFNAVRTATGTTSPYTRGVFRWVIGPLAAQTISGTIRLVMRCWESNAGANATSAIAVKIIQSNGTDRAILLAPTASDSASSPYEYTTTLSSRHAYDTSENDPITLTSQSASQGDYLVIELGFRSATTTNRNVDQEIGDDSSSDLGTTPGETNQYCPWAEFSANISWYNPVTPKSVDGTLTIAGDITKKTSRSLTGTLTMDGTMSKVASLFRSFTGTLTTIGVLLKETRRSLTGTLSIAGLLASSKVVMKSLDGTLTTVGTLIKQSRRSLTGTLTTVGTLAKRQYESLVGTLTSSGSLLKQARRSLTGTLTSVGVLVSSKVALKSLTGTLTTAGTLIRQTRRSLVGTLTTSGTLTKIASFFRTYTGTLTTSGSLSKLTSRSLSGLLTTSGNIVKQISRSLAGILSAVGNLISQKISPQGQVPGTVDILDEQVATITLTDTVSTHRISIIDVTTMTVEIGDAYAQPI